MSCSTTAMWGGRCSDVALDVNRDQRGDQPVAAERFAIFTFCLVPAARRGATSPGRSRALAEGGPRPGWQKRLARPRLSPPKEKATCGDAFRQRVRWRRNAWRSSGRRPAHIIRHGNLFNPADLPATRFGASAGRLQRWLPGAPLLACASRTWALKPELPRRVGRRPPRWRASTFVVVAVRHPLCQAGCSPEAGPVRQNHQTG